MSHIRALGHCIAVLWREILSVVIATALSALVIMHLVPDMAHAIIMDVAIVCLLAAAMALYVVLSHVHDNDWHPISRDRLQQATTHRKSPSDASKNNLQK